MHYRDPKYNIGLHKIGVKLFGRPALETVRCLRDVAIRVRTAEEGKDGRGERYGVVSPQPDLRTAPTHTRAGGEGVELIPRKCTGHESFIGCKVVNSRCVRRVVRGSLRIQWSLERYSRMLHIHTAVKRPSV